MVNSVYRQRYRMWGTPTQIPRCLRCGGGSDVMQRMLKRLNYFDGQLLSADDFRAEQQYALETRRRHNRLLHGWGIVTGLGVAVSDRNTVTVEPGLALDPLGREVDVTALISVAVKPGRSPQWVVVSYCERDADPVLLLGGAPSRIEEGASVTLAARVAADGVVIGRIKHGARGWRIDRSFRPRKVRR